MSSKLKPYLILFIFAICFVQFWGICFVSTKSANDITCAIALVLTFISSYFIQKDFDFKLDVWQKLFFISLMLGYSSFFINGNWKLFLISPMFIGSLFFVFNFFVFKDLKRFRNWVFFVIVITTYIGWDYYDGWQKERMGYVDEKSVIIENSTIESTEKRQEVPSESIDISTFTFLNLKLDTVSIKNEKTYTFIGTWNETCYPCKRAIRELTPMLDTIDNIESYFIYENKKFDKEIFISSSKKVKELTNQNVLADYNQEFYKSMKMVAYPTFLIINNEEGKIVYMAIGYSNGRKKKLIENLLEVAKD